MNHSKLTFQFGISEQRTRAMRTDTLVAEMWAEAFRRGDFVQVTFSRSDALPLTLEALWRLIDGHHLIVHGSSLSVYDAFSAAGKKPMTLTLRLIPSDVAFVRSPDMESMLYEVSAMESEEASAPV
jgi:hypothetical protein